MQHRDFNPPVTGIVSSTAPVVTAGGAVWLGRSTGKNGRVCHYPVVFTVRPTIRDRRKFLDSVAHNHCMVMEGDGLGEAYEVETIVNGENKTILVKPTEFTFLIAGLPEVLKKLANHSAVLTYGGVPKAPKVGRGSGQSPKA